MTVHFGSVYIDVCVVLLVGTGRPSDQSRAGSGEEG